MIGAVVVFSVAPIVLYLTITYTSKIILVWAICVLVFFPTVNFLGRRYRPRRNGVWITISWPQVYYALLFGGAMFMVALTLPEAAMLESQSVPEFLAPFGLQLVLLAIVGVSGILFLLFSLKRDRGSREEVRVRFCRWDAQTIASALRAAMRTVGVEWMESNVGMKESRILLHVQGSDIEIEQHSKAEVILIESRPRRRSLRPSEAYYTAVDRALDELDRLPHHRTKANEPTDSP